MIERTGDLFSMWGQPRQTCIATTNSQLNTAGLAIMGAGSALELKKRMPDAPLILSHWINMFPSGDYGYIFLGGHGFDAAVLQTKRHWREPSPVNLVAFSIANLLSWAVPHPDVTFNLPRPGCGLGGLDWETQVKPLLENAPDNVVVWSFA